MKPLETAAPLTGTLASAYTFASAATPMITSITPTSGMPGSRVDIEGTNLGGCFCRTQTDGGAPDWGTALALKRLIGSLAGTCAGSTCEKSSRRKLGSPAPHAHSPLTTHDVRYSTGRRAPLRMSSSALEKVWLAGAEDAELCDGPRGQDGANLQCHCLIAMRSQCCCLFFMDP